jgi:hypothetical protein
VQSPVKRLSLSVHYRFVTDFNRRKGKRNAPTPDDDFLRLLSEIYHDHDARTRSDVDSLCAMRDSNSYRHCDTRVCA